MKSFALICAVYLAGFTATHAQISKFEQPNQAYNRLLRLTDGVLPLDNYLRLYTEANPPDVSITLRRFTETGGWGFYSLLFVFGPEDWYFMIEVKDTHETGERLHRTAWVKIDDRNASIFNSEYFRMDFEKSKLVEVSLGDDYPTILFEQIDREEYIGLWMVPSKPEGVNDYLKKLEALFEQSFQEKRDPGLER